MNHRLTASAALLAIACVGGLQMLSKPSPRATPSPVGDRFVAVLEPPLTHCRRAAELNFDVSWASACMKQAERHAACMHQRGLHMPLEQARLQCDQLHGEPDASTDCTLPDERAASINAAYQDADGQCLADARTSRL